MAMQTIIKRSFPGVVLLLIAVVAYLQVRGTAALIEALLINPSRGPSGPRFEAAPPGPESTANPGRKVAFITFNPRQGTPAVWLESKDELWQSPLFGSGPPDSLLATLGLKSGDRLETINGFSVANPEQALQAYARLRTAEHLRVRVVRAGQPLGIDLHIG